MRVAAIYDIHGNLPALEAVLESIAREGADLIVVGGDVVVGPMTVEVMDRLLDVKTPIDFIQGNAEDSVLTEMAGEKHVMPFPEPIRDLLRWEAQQMTRFASILRGWPMTVRHPVTGLGEALFCHATPRDLNEIFVETTAEDVLRPIFEATSADVVVCGHTHIQFDRTVGRVRIVNAGSVGMPFDAPGAYWVMLGPGVELRRTGYDLAAAAARVRASGYPQAQQFAEGSILAPPSAAAMRVSFEKLAIGAPAAG